MTHYCLMSDFEPRSDRVHNRSSSSRPPRGTLTLDSGIDVLPKGDHMKELDAEAQKAKLDRRSVLGLAGTVIGASSLSGAQPAAASVPRSDIVMMDAVALSSGIHARRLSCVEVMAAYLDHIERINPKVNAIVALEDRAKLLAQAGERDAQLARGESMGVLHGFPHAVKDLQPVKGIRSTQGS